ncbi:MAG: hypothetical protein ACK4VP_03755 [Nitrospira sp.]
MRIICAWCFQEGKVALLGEKMPLDDPRETHGICRAHRLALQAERKTSLLTLADKGSEQPHRLSGQRLP